MNPKSNPAKPDRAELGEIIKIESGYVFVTWGVLSPANGIAIYCNKVLVQDASDLWQMADDIESEHFPQAFDSQTNLPRRHAQLLGRANELDEIVRLLLSRRLVTLVGAGGSGKTELCYEVARRIKHGYAKCRVVELADLPGDTHSSSLVQKVAETLSPNLAKGKPSTVASIVRVVGDERLLLVLDNCEHLTAACNELITELLKEESGLPNLQIMVTSREPIRCQHENVVDIAGLDFPHEDLRVQCLADLDKFASATLFMEQARGPTLRDKDAADIAEICRRLEGIPYAVKIVAAQADKRSVPQIVQSLKGILALKPRNAAHRHQKEVEAAQEWSYRRQPRSRHYA